jgi:NAD+ synthase (glutamine-hydrolysing)
MCRLAVAAVKQGNQQVIADMKRIAVYSSELPETAEALCNQILHTVYLGMEAQSSKETRQRAHDLAAHIGAYHQDVNIDTMFQSARDILTQATGFTPKFKGQYGHLCFPTPSSSILGAVCLSGVNSSRGIEHAKLGSPEHPG